MGLVGFIFIVLFMGVFVFWFCGFLLFFGDENREMDDFFVGFKIL